MGIEVMSGEIKSQPLNNNFSFLDSKLANLSIGPFKTYENLSSLQTAYPNGRNGFAVVLEADGKTGYMYTWSGTIWEKGGLAQSMGIADKSVTAGKMDDDYQQKLIEYNNLNLSTTTGFYSTYDKSYHENANYKTIKSPCLDGDIFLVTTKITDATVAVAMFFSDAACTIYHSHAGGGQTGTHNDYKVIAPTGVRGVAISSKIELTPILKKGVVVDVKDFKNATQQQLAYKSDLDGVIQNGFYSTINNIFNPNDGFKSLKASVIAGDKIYFSAKTTTATIATCVFWKSDGIKLLTVKGGEISTWHDIEAIAPAETTFVTVTSSTDFMPILKKEEGLQATEIYDKIDELEKELKESSNHLFGKKICWIGTSVPFGANATKSYAKEAANKLGFDLINASVPGQAIHTKIDGSQLTYGSTTLSKAEYLAQGVTIADSPLPYAPGGSYNSYYRTWENIFTAENADVDLWVFDVVPNNQNWSLSDWELFDYDNWRYTDDSSFADHRTTFLGALLFLMDKMYELNPKARMVFILGSSFSYVSGKNNLQLLQDKWHIPILDIWSKINTSPKSLMQIKSLDGTDDHPSTFAHEKLGNMLVNDLLTVS